MSIFKFKDETYGLIWGTVFLVIGLIILMLVFTYVLDVAQNPSEKLNQWVPEEIKEPTAQFNWWSNDISVEFNDISTKGSSEITSWNWDFADGTTSTEQHPKHEFPTFGNYTVTLEVEDENSKTHTSRARVYLSEGENNEGQTQTSTPLDLGLNTTLNRLTISIAFLIALVILVMIGGRLLAAGCRLIRPNIQIYKMKMKPKETDKKEEP